MTDGDYRLDAAQTHPQPQNPQRNRQLQQHDSDRALKRVVFPVLVISVVMLWAVMATAVMGSL
jgi:hypothetical protein